MMRESRITVVEYHPRAGFVAEACRIANVTDHAVRQAVSVQGERAREILGIGTVPFYLDNDTLMTRDVAGLIRLLPNLEMEIAPKFLGDAWPSWREDFLLVANVARSGQLLIREGITSSTGARDDLASLVAHTFVSLFEENRRRPLRTYRPQTEEEWSLDGEVDPEEILLPGADGYRVRRLTLSGRNRYNAQVASAARLLAPEVRDGVLQRQVRRVGQRLGPQPASTARPRATVPSRHRAWQQCYDLAKQINAGFGLRLAPGAFSSPGYLLTTWLAFEHLLVTAMRVGLRNAQVSYHPRVTLGTRSGGSPVFVEPDLMVRRGDGALIVLDAKYKGRAESTPSITAADLYEGLAFAEATGQQRTTLLYPRPPLGSNQLPVGSVELFDEITVGTRVIAGATIECRGISTSGGFLSFANGLGRLVQRDQPPMS
jgi:5-methylcytosine-specific restriction enzyme subunit McrC